MLAVISDLHFAEERSLALDPDGRDRPGGSRNLSPRAFERFFATLADAARRDRARRLDLVLAGDVFDLHRTGLWFEGPSRPYREGEELESVAGGILEAIAGEPPVAASLEAVRRLAEGRYADDGRELEFPVPVRVHYLPGNHDRLVNRFPALRRRVRELLGIPGGGERFPDVLHFDAERVLVRHGHEYDRYNFALDLGRRRRIPVYLPEEAYDRPAFGDLVTVEVAVRLPWLFREHHGADRVSVRPDLRAVYARLLAFDDVRPQSALPQYLLAPGGIAGVPQARVWRAVEPVLRSLLEELAGNRELLSWLRRLERRWRPDVIDLVQAALGLRAWRLGIPLGLVRRLLEAWRARSPAGPGPEEHAAREEAVAAGDVRLVVAGHTHRPGVAALPSSAGEERLYVDTGTWRRRVLAAATGSAFVELKALAAVTVYAPDEDPGRERRRGKEISFDFWDGLTRRYFVPAGEGGPP